VSLFGKIVRTTINVVVGLPVAVVKDVVTLGNAADFDGSGSRPFVAQKLDQIKEEAED
jgi:Mg2+/citrate symporter